MFKNDLIFYNVKYIDWYIVIIYKMKYDNDHLYNMNCIMKCIMIDNGI